MTPNLRIMNSLIQIAKDVQPVGGAKIAAAIVYKDRIISLGTNQRKSHPLQKRYAKNDEAIFLHAEIDAIRKHNVFVGSTLYLARVFRSGRSALVSPCSGCLRALSTYGITTIYHTGNINGRIEVQSIL